MTHYMSTVAAATLALAMTATSGIAQQAGGQGGSDAGQGEATTFDIDRDVTEGTAAFEVFNKGFTEFDIFGRWDIDKDDLMSWDEFSRGVYASYDLDRDEYLTQDEIVGMGEDRIFADEPFVWEGDRAAYEDFRTGYDRTSYMAWDTDRDEMLSRDEFTRGMFSLYDVDQNQVLDEGEIAAMQRDRVFTY